ncbi:rRNA methyltransferase 1, mitochondrial-like [Ylistrum balloti]|uniref:rRNA methyltransferase 1, mitochondrial-like n=1 Tax=Ylistrum balloti TaxID=509963 RepID=UPI002905AEB2|nr:rRNA methyltransferase 1, mitochondrial-like [Ylistrum balloti]
MSAIVRQLCRHFIQGRQPVNVTQVLCARFSPRQCHSHAAVTLSDENLEKESSQEKPTGRKARKLLERKSSFERLRRSKENNSMENNDIGELNTRRETRDNFHFKEENKHARNFDDGFQFGGEKKTFRRKNSDNDFQLSVGKKNFRGQNSAEFHREEKTFRRKQMGESKDSKNVNDGNKSKLVQGSGNRFGVQYRNKKFPFKGEILFGYHPVSIALSHRRRHCHKLFVQRGRRLSPDVDILGLAKEAKIPVEEVSRIHLDQLCLGRPHQGICMDADPLDIHNLSPDDTRAAILDPPPIWLLPYEIVDPMNMGAIIRSSYYFGVDAVVLSSHHSATASPMVSKASSGAMEVMKFFNLKNKEATTQFLEDWRANVGQIIGTATGPGTVEVTECVVNKPTLLIVGNEHHGLKDEILKHCDQVIKLRECTPDRQSLVESLNVSVATGIVLHTLTTNKTNT